MTEDTTRRTDWTIVVSYYLIWLGSSLLAGKTAYLSSYTMAGLDTIMLIAIFWRSKELKRPIDINLLRHWLGLNRMGSRPAGHARDQGID